MNGFYKNNFQGISLKEIIRLLTKIPLFFWVRGRTTLSPPLNTNEAMSLALIHEMGGGEGVTAPSGQKHLKPLRDLPHFLFQPQHVLR